MDDWHSSYALSSSLLALVAIVHRNQTCIPAKIAPAVRNNNISYGCCFLLFLDAPLPCAGISLVVSDSPACIQTGRTAQNKRHIEGFPYTTGPEGKDKHPDTFGTICRKLLSTLPCRTSSIFGNLIQCISADVTNLPDSRPLGAMYLYSSVTHSLQSRYPPNPFYQDGTFT
jgi:hypothetical protein